MRREDGEAERVAPADDRGPEWPYDRSELLPFLPLIYVAWADGVLTGAEIRTIRDRIQRQEWLDVGARTALDRWLDPDAPPTPVALAALRDRIRGAVGPGTDESSRSLVSLGVDLARAETGGDGVWADASAREALDGIEASLGVVGAEATRELLGQAGPGLPAGEAGPGPFDVTAMNRYLDGDHWALRREVFELLEEETFQMPLEISRDRYRARVRAALERLARRGYGFLPLPGSVGGRDDLGAFIALFETLAHGDLSLLVKMGVQWGLFAGAIRSLGSERHHRAWLAGAANLELPGCFAMTESAHGSNVRDLETTATYDPESREFVVHTPRPEARKDWIGGAALDARIGVVFAQLEVAGERHGVHAFVVPLRTPEGTVMDGVHIEDCGAKEGLNGVDNGRIVFDRVRIPRENLLDRFGQVLEDGTYRSPIPGVSKRFFTMLGTLVGGRISIAAASNSAAKTGLAIAVRYGDARRQFGPAGAGEVPILDYLVHQRLLLPRLADAYALDFAVRGLVRGHASGSGEDPRRLEARAAGLKAYASRFAVDTLQACREACGGRGYLAANRFGRLKADVDVFTTFEGANPVLWQLVSRSLLSEFKEEMGDLRLWGMVRHLADRAATRVAERNPVATRRSDEDHLRDPAFHRMAFRYREERLLGSAASRLRDLIGEGVDTFEAMNRVQDHLVTLARAHIEAELLEAFQRGVLDAPPELREILGQVCTLHALSTLERHRGWYLESGYFEGVKSKAVRAQVNALCGALRPHAVALVDAFGIPDRVLAAPAAFHGREPRGPT